MKYSFITEQLINTVLYLEPFDLNRNIDNIILLRLKQKFEGLCYKDGIIINDTIQLIKRNIGKIETYNNKSIIKFNITFKADIISPSDGEEIDIYVNNINKMGIIGYIKISKYNINNSENSPLIVIIPLEYIKKDIKDININDKLKIRILGRRVKLNSDKIQIVGELKNE